ncbi:MAG: Rieske 2Fe-2S domain-containing protein [Terriglobia bacterium]
MTEQTQPTLQTPEAEMLTGCWYPALRSPAVRSRKLQRALLLGVPLVIGRDAHGRIFALHDLCPHRGMPLSFGHLDGELLACCYHGWRFEPTTGQCREIPSLTARDTLKVDRIFAQSFPCAEADGYVWVYIPDPAVPGGTPLCGVDQPLPPVPRLPVFSPRYRLTHLAAELPSNVDHGIIGLMDPAHGPFVHNAWWWRRRGSIQEKEKVFEPIPNGFRIRAHAPSPNSAPYKLLRIYGQPVTTTIEFVLPNMRFEQIRCGPYWFSSRATVTPLTRDRSRIDFCAAWNIFPRVPFLVPIFRLFARMFLRQDTQTMTQQALGLRYNPTMMLIDDADRPAKWYFQLKAAYREAKRTGQPMQHPLPGSVTLRWRS